MTLKDANGFSNINLRMERECSGIFKKGLFHSLTAPTPSQCCSIPTPANTALDLEPLES